MPCGNDLLCALLTAMHMPMAMRIIVSHNTECSRVMQTPESVYSYININLGAVWHEMLSVSALACSWGRRQALQGHSYFRTSQDAREGHMGSPVEHAACGEDQEPVVPGRHCDRLMRPGVELQLPAVALAPVRVQVQDGGDAPAVDALIAVVVQREAAAVTCIKHSQPCSTYWYPV